MTFPRIWTQRLLSSALACLFVGSAGYAQTIRQDVYVTDGTVNTMVVNGRTLYIGGDFAHVGAATGGGVSIDAASGTPVSGFARVTGSVQAVVPDGSGGWYIGGSFTAVGGVARLNIAHVLVDNTVSTWSPNSDGPVRALALSGSTVYAGGSFTTIGGRARHHLAALDAATGLSTEWDPNPDGAQGVCACGFCSPDADSLGILSLAVSGSTIYAGGNFTQIGGQIRNSLAALDASTGLATAWNPNVDYVDPFCRAEGCTGDLGFGGVFCYGPAVDTLAVNGSTIYIGGRISSVMGQTRSGVAAVDMASGLPEGWNPMAGSPSYPEVNALTVSGSTVLAGGYFSDMGGQARNNLAAVDATTGLATSWNPNAGSADYGAGTVTSLAMSGSTVYVGGLFTTIAGQARNHLAALDVATGLPTGWNPNAGGLVDALAVSASRVYAGGSFNSLGSVERNRLAALDAATGLVTPWDPNVDGYVKTLAVAGSTIYVGGGFYSVGGERRKNIAALDAASGRATSWNPDANGLVAALAVSGRTVYAGGSFSAIGGQARNNLAALDEMTGLATAWNPEATIDWRDDRLGLYFPPGVLAITVRDSIVYAGGVFNRIGGQERNFIAALDAATGLATAWDPNANAPVEVIAVRGPAVYVGGYFSTIGGRPRTGLAALDTGAGLAAAWDPHPLGPIFALAVSGPAVYAGGGFSNIGGQARNNLAAVDATTGLATTWDPSPSIDPADYSFPYGPQVLALAVGGRTVYAGGNFTAMGNLPQSHVAAMTWQVGQSIPTSPRSDR